MPTQQIAIVQFILLLSIIGVPLLQGNQIDQQDDLFLEIKTLEVMVEQLEKMPQLSESEKDSFAGLSMKIQDKFAEVISYDTKDNIDIWVLLGRWATAKGVTDELSPYANAPFFHIKRIRPDYQKDERLVDLMARLNAIRNKEHDSLESEGYQKFINLFEKSDISDPAIQLKIGKAYEDGDGLWCNISEAIKWYKMSSDNGNADALAEIGEAYIYGSGGIQEDEKVGVSLMEEALKKGSINAALKLGNYYAPMPFLKRKADMQKAIEMYRIAAENGCHSALYPLAKAYAEIGNGTEAIRWADGGDEPDKNDKAKHLKWEKTRFLSDSSGMCTYVKAEVYAFGIGNVEQDLAKAVILFEESYKKGNKYAAIALAAIYKEGIDVETNDVIAQQWEKNVSQIYGQDYSNRYAKMKIDEYAKRLREGK